MAIDLLVPKEKGENERKHIVYRWIYKNIPPGRLAFVNFSCEARRARLGTDFTPL